jgi:xanthine dehydrogenase YagS FAD-binding subunit
MREFTYRRADTVSEAAGLIAGTPGARLIAGGTDLVNLLKDRIEIASVLVDINPLGLTEVGIGPDGGLRLGALARMSDVAAHPLVARGHRAVAESLESSASPQLRNVATIGGNLMQRTRCPYFRGENAVPCNKRRPGSGCAAAPARSRSSAVFGWSEHCRATHPSDLAVALAVLDASVRVLSSRGERILPVTGFHRLPGDTPEVDTLLGPDEVITGVEVPPSPPSRYVKLRDRASYEFALVSAAAVVEAVDGVIVRARIALGGVAAKPWRLTAAESALEGVSLSAPEVLRALEMSFSDATPAPGAESKVELSRRAAARAVLSAGGVS